MIKSSLRRYTNLPATLHILQKKSLTLLSPSSWDDRNDAYCLTEYKNRLKAGSVLALCFAAAPETYHHWRVFSPGSGGVCLEFDKDQLQECVQDDPRFRCDSVIYRMINTVTTKGFKTDQLPFVKRFPYRDEKEFRILFVDMAENNEFKQFGIPLSSIKRITLSPWMPKALVTAVKSTLKSIKGCQKLRVNRSTLVENERWKCAVNLKRK